MVLFVWNLILFTVFCTKLRVEAGISSTCDVINPAPGDKLDYVDTEWNNLDLVQENSKRSLFCKVNNYCELWWYDGVTKEPINHEVGFIEFEENNQTLVLRQARLSDQRNYTCEASKDRDTLKPRTTTLYVLDDSPVTVSVGVPPDVNCGDKTSQEGDTIELFCLYTITSDNFLFMNPYWTKLNGTGNSTDFLYMSTLNEVNRNQPEVTTWYEETVHLYKRDYHETRVYDPGDVFFIYNTTLIIHNMSADAYGLFKFTVQLDSDARKTDHRNMTISPITPPNIIITQGVIGIGAAFIGFILLGIVFGLTYHKKKTSIKLYLKDNANNCICKDPELTADNKESDAYISYSHIKSQESSEEIDFVVNVLEVELKKRGYNVIVRDTSIDRHLPGTCIHEEIMRSLDESRRCILVISPSYINSWVGNFDINVMMDNVKNCKRQIIPIIFRDVDVSSIPESNNHRLLKHIMDMVHCLRWPVESDNDKPGKLVKKRATFFQELMLRMPPRRYGSRASGCRPTNTSMSGLTTNEETTSETTPPNSTTNLTLNRQNEVGSIYPNLENGTRNTNPQCGEGDNSNA